jgi:cytochrome b involved in lipid metabolism
MGACCSAGGAAGEKSPSKGKGKKKTTAAKKKKKAKAELSDDANHSSDQPEPQPKAKKPLKGSLKTDRSTTPPISGDKSEQRPNRRVEIRDYAEASPSSQNNKSSSSLNGGKVPGAIVGNPLSSPDAQRQWKAQLDLLSEEESKKRKLIYDMQNRQFDLHRFDFKKDMPKKLDIDSLISDPNLDEDESSSRKCSMSPSETAKAAQTGKEYVRTPQPEDLDTRSPAANSGIPTARVNVAKHHKEDDLWVIIRNKVYDLTSFQASHPGGSWVLLQVAGKDATSVFEKQHSATHLGQLREFIVGEVPKDERR